jgi:hypothetical protein
MENGQSPLGSSSALRLSSVHVVSTNALQLPWQTFIDEKIAPIPVMKKP